jgi:hypothetical protein
MSLFYFVSDSFSKNAFEDAFNAISELNLWKSLQQNYSEQITDFMYTLQNKPQDYDKLIRLFDKRMMHSRVSFVKTLLVMEHIAKYGFDDWKFKYIKVNRLDMVQSITTISDYYYESISNPNFLLCRKRLQNEFIKMTY